MQSETPHSSTPRLTVARWSLACIAALLQGLTLSARADSSAVYQWTDESGTVHFSQWPPVDNAVAAEKRRIASTNSPDYDPVDYRYSIENQAERIGETWDAILEEKEAEAIERRLTHAERRLAELEREASRSNAEHPLYVSPLLLHRPQHRFRPFGPGGFHDRHRLRPPRRPPDRTDQDAARPGFGGERSAAGTPQPGFARSRQPQ